MTPVAATLRERFHPLHRLRRHSGFRVVERRLDVPVWARLAGIDWKVRVRLVRHASYLLIRQTPEPELAALFKAIAQVFQPRVFWDVGANFGYYAWLLKSADRELQVSMFEPDASNLELIQATQRRAALPGVAIEPVAISSQAGEALFSVDPVSGATGTLEAADEAFSATHWGVRGQTVSVPTATLDSRRRDAGVDLIKVDVEGHEAHVFRGASSVLEHDRPVIVFESFPGAHDSLALLERVGYVLYDAERRSPDLTRGTNFLAIPEEHDARSGEVFARCTPSG